MTLLDTVAREHACNESNGCNVGKTLRSCPVRYRLLAYLYQLVYFGGDRRQEWNQKSPHNFNAGEPLVPTTRDTRIVE